MKITVVYANTNEETVMYANTNEDNGRVCEHK